MKAKLFNLRLLASLWNYNYSQIFAKATITVVKFNSKISIIYHQIKFRKGIMNRSPIKKPFLIDNKPFLINAGLQSWNFIKKRLQHRCFSVNIGKFLRTPVLKNICERLFERFPTWANNITSNRGIEEDIFSKTKQK